MNEAHRFPVLRVGAPAHRFIVPVPLAAFSAALATDVAYGTTGHLLWARVSLWLVAIGLAFAAAAAGVGLVAFVTHPQAQGASGFVHFCTGAAIVLTALWNLALRLPSYADRAWPWGAALSALTVVWMALSGWHGATLVRRRGGD